MSENKIEDYVESEQESSEGHLDTRFKNFECPALDSHLGYDHGIDVSG